MNYNVKDFGAVGDARKVTDAVTNGTRLVSSVSARFTAADVGKMVWCNDSGGGIALAPTLITHVIDGSSILTEAPAPSNLSGLVMVLGTDDSDAIIAANAAACATSHPSAIKIPAGGYIYSKRLFDHSFSENRAAPALVGDGAASTVFYQSPDFDYATTSGHSGAMFNREQNCLCARWSGFTIDGCTVARDYIHFAVQWYSGPMSIRKDIAVVNFNRVIAGIYTAGGETLDNLYVRYIDAIGMQVNGAPEFNNCYVGDCISGGITTSGCILFRWTGGILDESGGHSAQFNGCESVLFSNALIYAGLSGVALDLQGASGLRAINCNILPFGGHAHGTAVRVGVDAQAVFALCSLIGTGSGFALDNGGTVLDAGGNHFSSVNGPAPVPSP